MREFETGAIRDNDEGKVDYTGLLCPKALRVYCEYMNRHRVQADGNLRASDNWKKGIPKDAYLKSMARHFMEVWELHEEGGPHDALTEALCAVMFNVHGYIHELEKGK